MNRHGDRLGALLVSLGALALVAAIVGAAVVR